MAIELRLSERLNKENGKSELLMRLFHGRGINLRGRTGIYISPDFFEFFIDRGRTENAHVKIPTNKLSATKEEAEKKGYVLRTHGVLVINKRVETSEVKYHREQLEKVERLKIAIMQALEKTGYSKAVDSNWLQGVIMQQSNRPIEEVAEDKAEKHSFYELAELYIEKHRLSIAHARVFRVLMREIARYEGFTRATSIEGSNFSFDIDKVERKDIEDFIDYLRHEYELSTNKKYQKLFVELLNNYPVSVTKGNCVLQKRGENTVIKAVKRLKSLFRWFNEEGFTRNNPFLGLKIGTEKVGTPIYITNEERNIIAEANLCDAYERLSQAEKEELCKKEIVKLEIQRDIFVFHCFVGCRVGDLVKLTSANVVEGMLIYTPNKTKDNGVQSVQARVPLHPKALELIEKYAGQTSNGLLFPFITPQKYNDAIKAIFTLAGITRNVAVRNALTGQTEMVPINTVASSHLARRTFIGNLYFKVPDPNLIGKMSGHVEGSRAFARYRKIEDDTLRGLIEQLD